MKNRYKIPFVLPHFVDSIFAFYRWAKLSRDNLLKAKRDN